MDIITNNPYRILGVYSNSPTKERVASKAKLNAFLKVGKSVLFPLDLPELLPPIERKAEDISRAEADLTLPSDQIKYAQFWWMKSTPMDEIAFNHLLSGDAKMAMSIWEKKDTASSLQNRLLYSMIENKWSDALHYAETLYTSYSDEFILSVIGELASVSIPLWQTFLNVLLQSGAKAVKLIKLVTIEEWQKHISEETIAPLTESITKEIEASKRTRGKEAEVRLQSGVKLITSTKSVLDQLKQILSDDFRYQTIADKLATEILQCGIDYYNGSDDDDCAMKALTVQKYAYSIAVGSMVKERCKENVEILEKTISELPPASVISYYKAVHKEIKKYVDLPDEISVAINLLRATKPHLDSMKPITGASDPTYLKLSTTVVGIALGKVIEEVNEAQRPLSDSFSGVFGRHDDSAVIFKIKSAANEAWKAILLMDKFDMDPEFKRKRYSQNREILKEMCDQLQIQTTTPSLKSKPYSEKREAPKSYKVDDESNQVSSPSLKSKPYSEKREAPKSYKVDDESNQASSIGCLLLLILFCLYMMVSTTCS